MLSSTRLSRLFIRKSLHLKQSHSQEGIGAIFRGIPGSSAVERAMQKRKGEDTREHEGVVGRSSAAESNTRNSRKEGPEGTQGNSLSLAVPVTQPTDPMLAAGQEHLSGRHFVTPKNYMRRVSNDFYAFAKRRPLPQVPWLQDTKKSYLDDAERIFGRKEGWHMHPDPNVRRKLLMILKAFVTDTVRQSNELRGTCKIRRAKLRRLSAEYAHYMLVAAFDDQPVERIRREWRVPKTAEDLLREEEAKENAPMLEILKLAELSKQNKKETAASSSSNESIQQNVKLGNTEVGHSNEEGLNDEDIQRQEGYQRAAEVRERLQGSAATSDVSLVDPFATFPSRRATSKKVTEGSKKNADPSIVDMQKEGLMHMRFAQSGPTNVEADLAAARKTEQSLQFPFLRSRVTEDKSTLDSSLVDWTRSFFPEDTSESLQAPEGLHERQMALAAEDRAAEASRNRQGDTQLRAAKGSQTVRNILGRLTGGGQIPVSSTEENYFGIGQSGNESVQNQNNSKASPLDDVDEDEVRNLRLDRAVTRLEGDKVLKTGILDDIEAENGEAHDRRETAFHREKYEDELFKLQSQSKQQLSELKAQRRREKVKAKRDKANHDGRYALTKSLEHFIKGRISSFDGEGLQFDEKSSGHKQQRVSVDHQGVALAKRPKTFNVRSRGQMMKALGVDTSFSSGDVSKGYKTAYDDDHYDRFSSSARKSTGPPANEDEGAFIASDDYGQSQSSGDLAPARHMHRGRRHLNHEERFMNDKGSVKVDWTTTVLSRQAGAGAAGPKWHRANERLIRIARGENV